MVVYLKKRILQECSCFIEFMRVRGKRNCQGLPSILWHFRNEFNKFNNTGARMLVSIYHMTLKSRKKLHFWHEMSRFLPSFTYCYHGRHYVTLLKCRPLLVYRRHYGNLLKCKPSGLSILLQVVISLPDVTSCDKGFSIMLVQYT